MVNSCFLGMYSINHPIDFNVTLSKWTDNGKTVFY
jgi:hypothetical protein